MPDWLKNAVFYEIYPQSFNDTNDDGIGDIQGIIEKLDYIRELGVNAIWINPWYDSPFKDAGYDVRDYKKVASRYGTNGDAKRLFEIAHSKGIHIILDLVPGHTSEEHEWFKESGKAIPVVNGVPQKNEHSDRYIWTEYWLSGIGGHPYISGECERNGVYMLNFFKSQPALNYGFASPTESWQMSYKDPEPQKTLELMMDVMRYWLDMGCDGFRVDMADSLVKDDDDRKSCTCSLWKKVRAMLDSEYPDAAIVSEWSNPEQSLNNAGFHMDFYLDHAGNGYNRLFRDYETLEKYHVFPIAEDRKNTVGKDRSYFKKDGDSDASAFLSDYIPKYEKTKDAGYICFMTCNHDTPRPARTLGTTELKIAYATIFTLPGVPYIYYGDEIGMRYIENIPTKEGGYTRTVSRTPMQWDSDKANMGFSNAPKDKLYLPVDEEGPAVNKQEQDKDSLYNVVKDVLAIRGKEKALCADEPFEVLCSGKDKPFVYKRGNLIMMVNPGEKDIEYTADYPAIKSGDYEEVYSIGRIERSGEKLVLKAQSFGIVRLK